MVLHGAVVSRDGAGAVLIGATGAGKSTLTAYAWQAGWTVGGDDGAEPAPHNVAARRRGTPGWRPSRSIRPGDPLTPRDLLAGGTWLGVRGAKRVRGAMFVGITNRFTGVVPPAGPRPYVRRVRRCLPLP